MKKGHLIVLVLSFVLFVSVAFNKTIKNTNTYRTNYIEQLNLFKKSQEHLIEYIQDKPINDQEAIDQIKLKIDATRLEMKGLDFWFRYLDPIAYKKINGPLPVEWETEVFEKFEKPYKREGAGFALAFLYLDDPDLKKDSLLELLDYSFDATGAYVADSVVEELSSPDHFYFCNRLFLLNLSSIYTTGFECPNAERIVPELKVMLNQVKVIYHSFNESFPQQSLPEDYLKRYEDLIYFVDQQPIDYVAFNHYEFIQKYVNPLFSINQELIAAYHLHSTSLVDYSLSKTSKSIFSKQLYRGQNPKGIFIRVQNQEALSLLDKVGKLLFYDPVLSGNNQRSCVSCHKPTEYFTDTSRATALQFNPQKALRRNSPSLINSEYNHLLMFDGKHISLQDQARAVITDPLELGAQEEDVLKKVLSCKEYKEAFEKLLVYTPQEKKVTFDHLVSALTFYYSKFSYYDSPFDESMNGRLELDSKVKAGFNVYMSKAQCATCHFVPQFNGVKPPFVNSEFEVLGVPSDKKFSSLDEDEGRYEINAVKEMHHAFRTGSLRNIQYTKPYMHNGVFNRLEEVVDFYDAGGGQGRGLLVENQTLSSDSLHLSKDEKDNLVLFMQALTEKIPFEFPPSALPHSHIKSLNTRKVGGEY